MKQINFIPSKVTIVIATLQRDLESSQKSLGSVRKRNGTLEKELQDAVQRCGQLQVTHVYIFMHTYVRMIVVYFYVNSHEAGDTISSMCCQLDVVLMLLFAPL